VEQDGAVSAYEPMAIHLETEQLSMQLWAEPDAGELCALISERGGGTPWFVMAGARAG